MAVYIFIGAYNGSTYSYGDARDRRRTRAAHTRLFSDDQAQRALEHCEHRKIKQKEPHSLRSTFSTKYAVSTMTDLVVDNCKIERIISVDSTLAAPQYFIMKGREGNEVSE